MRKYLLPEKGTFYKANLHCHTVLSDGMLTPLQVRELYRSRGYSVVAFTDHNAMLPHPELRTPDFLPLTGYELNVNGPARKTAHFNFIAMDEDNDVQPVLFRDNLKKGAVETIEKCRLAPEAETYVAEYSPENITKLMRTGREKGFFVIYNHPDWSLEVFGDYGGYHGMHAMEIVNYGCVMSGYDDVNYRVYDEFLHAGERIFCDAADDYHNKLPPDDPRSDSCGGWTMIKAPALEYSAVTSALAAGDCYASTGPEIRELWIEDGRVHIGTSDAAFINAKFGVRGAAAVSAGPAGAVNSLDFNFPYEKKWFRITVRDARGFRAWTRAYFADELPPLA